MTIIILLGAQNDDRGRLTPMALARARGALVAYRSRPRPRRILVTGGFGGFNRTSRPHAHYLAEHLRQEGVADDDLLPYAISAHTVDDAVQAKRILDHLLLDSIQIITSRFHLPRARFVFEHFFDPANLSFVGTPDAVDAATLRRMALHERRAMQTLCRQGGIMLDGIFVPTQSLQPLEKKGSNPCNS